MGPGFKAVGVDGKEVVGKGFEDGFVVFFGDGAGTAEQLVYAVSTFFKKVGTARSSYL